MNRTKANFRALREIVGMSQQDMASAMRCGLRSVKRWEDPNAPYWAPDPAWAILEERYAIQQQMCDYAVAQCERVEEEHGRAPKSVPVVYYRDQREYDEHGRDAGLVTVANANARAVFAELVAEGYDAQFVYPVPETEDTRPRRDRGWTGTEREDG